MIIMPRRRPLLSVEQILAWADAHKKRLGYWPHCGSGPIHDAPGETWTAINSALTYGNRGLPGGCTLTRLLKEQRGKIGGRKPVLTPELILSWAEKHRRRTGRWPTAASGAVQEAPGENWRALDSSLRAGNRGLKGGDSLARLLRRSSTPSRKTGT
jgi:hypothetical protein